MARLQVHRQGRAQVDEPRVHLARDRSAVCARAHVGGEQARVGPEFVQVLCDRERVPHHHVAVGERRHEERRREQHQLRACRRVVARQDAHIHVELGEPAQQPAAQGPRAVIPAVDRQQRVSHACSSRYMDVRKVPGVGLEVVRGGKGTCSTTCTRRRRRSPRRCARWPARPRAVCRTCSPRARAGRRSATSPPRASWSRACSSRTSGRRSASTRSPSAAGTSPCTKRSRRARPSRPCSTSPRTRRRRARRCSWSRRCPATSRRCCATPCARCSWTSTCTSPTGTTRATSRSTRGRSASRSTSTT